jgi:hypothetical protein
MRKSVISDIITRYYEEWFEDAESELLWCRGAGLPRVIYVV